MNIFITTDTHFGHESIKTLCGRPKDFEKQIIKSWEEQVTDEDLVIVLGDIAWNLKEVENFKKLKGRKILVRGNHDTKSLAWYMQNGFDAAVDEMVMKLQGINILFTHAPKIFHEYDINVHGHLHNCAKVDSVCQHFPIALETMGYGVFNIKPILKAIKKQLKSACN